ncbi:MAG: hypothetical protein GXY81_05715 [Candidatus Cloacimonetes bacterium]|nr:hypothetical protein [Candidatus Cloacimonadota bacterium]
MKKLIYTLLALVFATVLSAQTGLFNLSYGMDADEASEILSESGFELYIENGNRLSFIDYDNYYVDEIVLNFSDYDGTLENWVVYYLQQDDEDIEDLVLDALIERHGDDFAVDFYNEVFIWELDDIHTIVAGWDDYYLYVEYSTE